MIVAHKVLINENMLYEKKRWLGFMLTNLNYIRKTLKHIHLVCQKEEKKTKTKLTKKTW